MKSQKGAQRRIAILAAGMVLIAAVPGAAQLRVSQNVAASVNPPGASAVTRVVYGVPLWGGAEKGPTGVLWDTAQVEGGLYNQFTPAFNDVGLEVFVEPIAVFDLRVRLAWRTMFNALGFGFTVLDAGGGNAPPDFDGPLFNRTGTMVEITPRLKAAVGPLVVLNPLTVRHVRMEEEPGESGWFYEPLADEPLGPHDWFIQNSTLVLYQLSSPPQDQLLLGVDNTLGWASGDGLRRWRVAATGVWATKRVIPGAELSLLVQVGGYPRHRAYSVASGDVYGAVQAGVAWRW